MIGLLAFISFCWFFFSMTDIRATVDHTIDLCISIVGCNYQLLQLLMLLMRMQSMSALDYNLSSPFRSARI